MAVHGSEPQGPALMPDVVAAPPPLQRAHGKAALTVALRDGRSRIARLHQAGCLKLRFPRLPQSRLESVLVNTAGGLTGGDRLEQAFHVEPGAALTLTTQACERLYRSLSDDARVETHANVAAGASFAYLPQETILYDGARLRRRLEVDAEPDARLLLCESVILGRAAMGEEMRIGALRESWRVRLGGQLCFAEEMRFEGELRDIAARAAALGDARAFATIVASAESAQGSLPQLRDLLGSRGGASMVGPLCVARLVASSGMELRRRLVPALALLAGQALPRLWSS